VNAGVRRSSCHPVFLGALRNRPERGRPRQDRLAGRAGLGASAISAMSDDINRSGTSARRAGRQRRRRRTRQVVVGPLLDLRNAPGVGTVAFERISVAASAGTTPVSAHPSRAASSTSSQRSSLPSSDQILAISGRE
jgi:hypothetical protein